MSYVRAIGRWSMTALVINSVVGSGIFGLPSELTRLLGRASPLAMIAAGAVMALPILCMAEVASQFSEPGGPYLYVRTAFGKLPSIQVGWFHLLAAIGGGAASAVLFVSYLTSIVPWVGRAWLRPLLLLVLIGIPAIANYVGVRSGARLINLLTISKLLPLVLVIGLGLVRFGHGFEVIRVSEITSPGRTAWLTALLLLVFSYAGSEDALVPAAEIRQPHKTIPFSLLSGVLACVILYALVQLVTVSVIGRSDTDRPLAVTASVLVGRSAETLVALSVMVSTYGWLAGAILNLPRLASSLAAEGEFPKFLAALHPRFNTPGRAILFFAAIVWLTATSGTFLWAAAVSGGATIIIYTATCCALIRLRHMQRNVNALRIPFGRTLAVLGIIVMAAMLTRLSGREALAMCCTGTAATVNWLLAKKRSGGTISLAAGST